MAHDPLERAFGQVSERAWRLAYALTFCVEDAEDLLQQALLVAAKKRRCIPDDDPWPWFAAVIHNEARNLRRKRARQSAATLEEAIMATADANPPDDAAREEELQQLRDAMRQLPTKQRDALAAGYIAGLTQRQAAGALGIPVGSYKKQVRDGLAELRRRLKVDDARAKALLPLFPAPAMRPGWESLMLQSLSTGATTGATLGGVIVMKKLAYIVAGILAVAIVGIWAVPRIVAPESHEEEREAATHDAPLAANPRDEPEISDAPSERERGSPRPAHSRPSSADERDASRPDGRDTSEAANDRDAPEGASAKVSTGVLSGRVIDGKSRGVADARVAAGGATVTTGAGGEFEIEHGWRGSDSTSVRLTAVAEGMTAATSREVTLRPGGTVSNLVLILHEGAVVFGHVVWKGTNDPARGVEVDATPRTLDAADDDSDPNFAARSTTTSSSGEFRLSGLVPGEWFVRAMNFATQVRVVPRDDGPRPPRQADSEYIKLRESEEKGPLTLELPRQMKLRWTLASPVEGRVFVRLLEEGRSRLPSYGGWGVGINPGDDGVYELDWLAADHRQLRIKADGFAETSFNIRPRDGEDLDLGELTLNRGATLNGRVEDAAGRGIEGAEVYIRSSIDVSFVRSDGRDPRAKLAGAATDRNGNFELSALSAGGFEIVAEHSDYARTTAKVGIRNDEDPQPVVLVLQPSGTIFGIVTNPGEPADEGWNGVRATSMDEARLVELVTLKPDYAGFLGKKGPHAAELDADGGYELTGLSPGNWFVVAYRGGKVDFQISVAVEAGGRTRADFDFSQRTGSISGNVTLDGSPAAAEELLVVGLSGRITRANPRYTTLERGGYQFEDILPGTWYILTPDEAARMDARVLARRKVEVVAGRESNFDIDLDAVGATLEGRVTLNGAPFYEQLTLSPGFQGATERDIRVSPDGSFSGTALEPGLWHAWFRGGSGSDLGVAHALVEVTQDSQPWQVDFTAVALTANCGIELPERQRVSVQLLNDSPESDAAVFSLAVGGAGPFVFARLVSARYRFTLEVPGYAPVVQEVDLSESQEIDLTPSAEGAVLTVKFKNAEGFDEDALRAWQYGEVWAEQEGYTSDKRMVPIRENYAAQVTFESLQPGEVTIQFRGDAFEPQTVLATVQSGEPGELEITPHKGARLILKSAEPIELPQVEVTGAGGEPVEVSQDVLSDAPALAAGKLQIGPLKPGSYEVVVSRDGKTATVQFAVTRGQELELPMPSLTD